MNSYYIRSTLLPFAFIHKVIVVTFQTTRKKLAFINPMFFWLEKTSAHNALLRHAPDAMTDGEIFETQYNDMTILFIKQRENTSIRTLIQSCLKYAEKHNYTTIELPIFEIHHTKNSVKTMVDAIQACGSKVDVIFSVLKTQSHEIVACEKLKLEKA